MPALGNRATSIVPNREAQRRHPLHVGGAAAAVSRSVGVVGDLVRIDAN